jgi:hypothetical protein
MGGGKLWILMSKCCVDLWSKRAWIHIELSPHLTADCSLSGRNSSGMKVCARHYVLESSSSSSLSMIKCWSWYGKIFVLSIGSWKPVTRTTYPDLDRTYRPLYSLWVKPRMKQVNNNDFCWEKHLYCECVLELEGQDQLCTGHLFSSFCYMQVVWSTIGIKMESIV